MWIDEGYVAMWIDEGYIVMWIDEGYMEQTFIQNFLQIVVRKNMTETGWASPGDANEGAATVQNARTYHYN
ncbi:hypothetical protein L1987_52895 [Smallanthus sonchifolius]|uniref:Uncharacterized protein n=1 Tax=Smallanthus sonchifolius TaxID=185202 RepID=A0ACB9EUI3_9ASTR|nr:hypothetical protein L1987_52895 [Smallanthus sonchifolius]